MKAQAKVFVESNGTTLEASYKSRVCVVFPEQLKLYDKIVLRGDVWVISKLPLKSDERTTLYAYRLGDRNEQPVERLVEFLPDESVIVILGTHAQTPGA